MGSYQSQVCVKAFNREVPPNQPYTWLEAACVSTRQYD